MWETIEGVDVALYDEAIEHRTELLDALQTSCTTREVRAKTWRKLIAEVARWPRDAMWRHVAVPIAAHHAPRWPRQGVEALVPNAWIARAVAGEDAPELALAHTLILGPAQLRAPDVLAEHALTEGVRRLAACGALGHTYHLRLVAFGAHGEVEAWRALFDEVATPALREIVLYSCNDASTIVEAIVGSDALDRVHTLELEHCGLSGEALRALALAPRGDALKHLRLKQLRGDLIYALATLDRRDGALPQLLPPSLPSWLEDSVREARHRVRPWLNAADMLLTGFDHAEHHEREAMFRRFGLSTEDEEREGGDA